MQYVVYRRFRAKCLGGIVNLPYGTECDSRGEFIMHNGKPLVVITSENAHQFFARNDDGKGLERGQLTQTILSLLKKQYNETADQKQRRLAAWGRIWSDQKLDIYRMREHADHWLWNHAFFNAEISDLQYILKILKGGT
ncbi:MAG TPA: hypothetical protein IAC67_03675 [Candidatus Coproplasma excrementipullorum]|nr:hypothetical protein [Candidatus Coproplasma excrementipullorum]